MENKSNMLEKLLGRVGKFGQEYSTEYSQVPNNCLVQTLQKSKELREFNERCNPSIGLMNEILACYSMGHLMGWGIPILDVFKNVAESFTELGYREPVKAIMYIHDSVRQGDTMFAPMAKQGFFSPESGYLTAVGEESGDVDRALKSAADILEAKVKYSLRPEQVGEFVFLHGIRFLSDAGLTYERTAEILSVISKQFLIGPGPKILEVFRSLEAKNRIQQKQPSNIK